MRRRASFFSLWPALSCWAWKERMFLSFCCWETGTQGSRRMTQLYDGVMFMVTSRWPSCCCNMAAYTNCTQTNDRRKRKGWIISHLFSAGPSQVRHRTWILIVLTCSSYLLLTSMLTSPQSNCHKSRWGWVTWTLHWLSLCMSRLHIIIIIKSYNNIIYKQL